MPLDRVPEPCSAGQDVLEAAGNHSDPTPRKDPVAPLRAEVAPLTDRPTTPAATASRDDRTDQHAAGNACAKAPEETTVPIATPPLACWKPPKSAPDRRAAG